MGRVLTLGAIAATALVWSGCDAKKQTEYVAGVSTQVQVPRDLKAIRIDLTVGGALIECRAYRVYDGKVQLPRSLGEFPATGKPGPDPLTVTVTGFTEEFTEGSGKDVFDNCTITAAKVDPEKQPETRILRRSRQPYVLDNVLFLPMPLKYSCFDVNCAKDEDTCKAGRCTSAKIDETKLPKYSDDLIDGTGGACFPASVCFGAGVPAAIVDPNDCTYAVPGTTSAPPLAPGVPPQPQMPAGGGVNVEVTYDGGYNREILDKDPEEGFLIPDPAKPQRFRLSPGLCDLVKGEQPDGTPTAHRITSIRVTGLCQAKSPFQPLCANDQLAAMDTPDGVSANNVADSCHAKELTPAKSALAVLADDTTKHHIFYESSTDQAALNISLSDPAFKQTDIGLRFFPGRPGSCADFADPLGGFKPALKARDSIFDELKKRNPAAGGSAALLNPTTGDLGIGAAVSVVAADLKAKYPNANRRAILLVGNRGFEDASTCSPAPKAAVAAAKAAGVETYVIMLARDDTNGGSADAALPAVVPNAFEVAQAGSPPGLNLGAFDARSVSTKGVAQDAFRTVVEQIATCAYDVTAPLAADSILSYSDPAAIPPNDKTLHLVKPAPAGTCTTDGGTGDGWGVDATNPNRVRICGQSCADYRTALKKASVLGLQYQQPAAAVPVFAHKKACAPKP